MQDTLVDIVSLGLLVLFFGLQQRNRPEAYFRFWFAAWLLVLFGLVVNAMPLTDPHLLSLRAFVHLDTLFLASVVFLLSFLVRGETIAPSALMGVLVVIPGCAALNVTLSDFCPHWLLATLLLVAEAAAVHMMSKLVPTSWLIRRTLVSAVCLGFTALILVMAWRHAPVHLFPGIALAEVFTCSAIFYAGSTDWKSLEWYVGVAGFLTWAVSNLVPLAPTHQTHLLLTAWQLWHLPKYAVGFAMTLRIFEGGRHDMVRLAQRYKVLYEDFRVLYEDHPLPMWIYDAPSRRFLSVNDAACASYGYSRSDFLGMTLDEIAIPETQTALTPRPAHESGIAAEASHRARHRKKDGTIIAAELTDHDILFQGNEARFMLAMDVTEREKLDLELTRQAQHDALTGLPNRLLLDDRIEQCLLRSTREQRKAVLFTIDADRFKLINDSFGHLIGDECLKAMSERLRGRIRSVDTIARTGGEEFTAMIGGLHTREDAEKIAEMFVQLFDTPLKLPSSDLKVSISVGAALYPDDATDPVVLRRKSDQALYHAKRMGRNRYAFASREVCASFDKALAMEVALRDAIHNNGFELFFQPMYDSEGCAVRLEALIRFSGDGATHWSPADFIPVAEESGLILPIGAWVIEEACRHLVRWREILGDAIGVAINVSGKQLLQVGFSQFVQDTLQAHGLPPHSIELELTETALMSEPVLMRDSMAQLASTGIQFAIDDFGTGYSSLARLADLPISLLKIDRSFIVQLNQTQRANGIVTAIIQMAQTLQVRIVAEGVEEEDQLNFVLRKGCDLFQGFYLSKPMSAVEVTTAIEERNPLLLAHPKFTRSRVAVSRRIRTTRSQFPALTVAGDGAA